MTYLRVVHLQVDCLLLKLAERYMYLYIQFMYRINKLKQLGLSGKK